MVTVTHTTASGAGSGPGGTISDGEGDAGHTLSRATARLLGRTTASAGAVEEITVGSGLTLSAGSLSASGGAGWTQIATSGTLSGTGYDFTGIPNTYADLLMVWQGVSHNNGSNTTIQTRLTTGVSDTSQFGITTSAAASSTWYGALFIPGYTKPAGIMLIGTVSSSSSALLDFNSFGNGSSLVWRLSGGVTAWRVAPGAGSFDAGTLTLFGR